MAISLKQISKEIELDLTSVPDDKKAIVKREVGKFVIDEILRSVSEGDSPVDRRGKFKALNSEYAKENKGGNRTANLDLFGDMLDSLTFKPTTKGVEIGVFNPSQVPKADGHNNFSGKSTLPTRRFIPKGGEKFDKDIQAGVNEIIEDFSILQVSTQKIQPSDNTVSLNNLLDDDFLDRFLISGGFINAEQS